MVNTHETVASTGLDNSHDGNISAAAARHGEPGPNMEWLRGLDDAAAQAGPHVVFSVQVARAR